MKRPAVPRHHRARFCADLVRMRQSDCQWPRADARPRCGRCFRCDRDWHLAEIAAERRAKLH